MWVLIMVCKQIHNNCDVIVMGINDKAVEISYLSGFP